MTFSHKIKVFHGLTLCQGHEMVKARQNALWKMVNVRNMQVRCKQQEHDSIIKKKITEKSLLKCT